MWRMILSTWPSGTACFVSAARRTLKRIGVQVLEVVDIIITSLRHCRQVLLQLDLAEEGAQLWVLPHHDLHLAGLHDLHLGGAWET